MRKGERYIGGNGRSTWRLLEGPSSSYSHTTPTRARWLVSCYYLASFGGVTRRVGRT